MRLIVLLTLLFLLGCSSASKQKKDNLTATLHRCLVETNSSNRELPFSLDTAIIFYKSELGLKPILKTSKKDFFYVIQENKTPVNRIFSHKEAEVLKVSTISTIPFCLDRLSKDSCKGDNSKNCNYLNQINAYLKNIPPNKINTEFKSLIENYSEDIFVEKEIVYILLSIYYEQNLR
ncbi:MAG: hypothetical protein AAF960_29930 [Bacteroidota bacterium]